MSWSSTGGGSSPRSRASPFSRWEGRSPGWANPRPRSTAAMPRSPSTSTATARPPRDSRPSASGPGPLRPALVPHHTSVYVNFLMDEGEERIRQAYGADKYERLKALKRTYDPTNFFRLNQNIPPD